MANEKYPLIYIEWCDTISHEPIWKPLSDAQAWADNNNWIIRQVGFVVKKTKKYTLLASQVNFQKDCEPTISSITKIPNGCIVKNVPINIRTS